MAELERVGLQGVFETAEFNKGLAEYLKGLAKAADAASKAQSGTINAATGADKFARAVGIAGKAAGVLAVAAGTALVAGLASVAVAGVAATKAIVSFGQASIRTAGRVDELNRAALVLGQRMGLTADQTQEFIDNVIESGIRADVANRLIAQFAQRQLDLAQATELSALAQNLAVVAGIDSSDALDRLNNVVLTGNRLMARRLFLEIDFIKNQDMVAQSLGKTREQLTSTERAQANLDAVLREGANLSGVYAAAQGSPTKALRSLGREIFNIRAAVGRPFLEAWNNLIVLARKVTKSFSEMVSEGGVLFPVLVNLGAAASLATSAITATLENFFQAIGVLPTHVTGATDEIRTRLMMMGEIPRDAGETFLTNMINFLSEAATAAFKGGVEIMAALADGIVRGAAAALTAAMNAVEKLLGFWLAPGSPPRVARDIGTWGAETFTEYLRGFSEADFSVLGSLQDLLGEFLSPEALRGFSLDIGEAITTGPTPEFFSKLQQAAGDFGAEVVKLAKDYFALGDAIKQAGQAQKALDEALQRVDDSKVAVQDLVDEYNRLLRAGASDEVLDAQLAQINAAEEQLRLAEKQAKQAEESKVQAEERVETLEEETSLQEQLVDQLLKLAEEEEKAAREREGIPEREPTAPGAAGEFEQLGLGIGGAIGGGITTKIQEAIDNAKKLLLEKLGEIFAPLKERWERSIKPTLDELRRRFDTFKENVVKAWEGIKEDLQPIFDGLKLWWEQIIPDALELTRKAVEALKKWFVILVTNISLFVITALIRLRTWFGNVLLAMENVFIFVRDELIPQFKERLTDAIEKVSEKVEDLRDWFKDINDFIRDTLGETIKWLIDNFLTPLQTKWENIKRVVGELKSLLTTVIDMLIEARNRWRNLPSDGGIQEDVPPGLGGNTTIVPTGLGASPIVIPSPGVAMSNQFNFGGNTFPDQMSLAAFEARVVRIIRRELARGQA